MLILDVSSDEAFRVLSYEKNIDDKDLIYADDWYFYLHLAELVIAMLIHKRPGNKPFIQHKYLQS